jgi:hypothetical protein
MLAQTVSIAPKKTWEVEPVMRGLGHIRHGTVSQMPTQHYGRSELHLSCAPLYVPGTPDFIIMFILHITCNLLSPLTKCIAKSCAELPAMGGA